MDDRIRELIGSGDATRATQLLVESYGLEVFSYVASLTRDEDLASDAFSVACESVFDSVLGFRGSSTARTWFYAIARHAAYRELRSQRRRRGERISGLVDGLQAPIRTVTMLFQRTDVKTEIAKLRDSLSEEERELLVLRVDRNLSWADIAMVRIGPSESRDEQAREAARCRKQFERAKVRLRELAQQAGLLGERD